MTLTINDPRQFSKIYPDSNMLINQAQHDIAHNESNDLMCALVTDLLKQRQDQNLSVAYNLAPDFNIANYLWDCLQSVINNPNEIKQQVIAFPIVFVVGSKSQIELPVEFNTHLLKQLLLDKQVLISDNCYISNKLYDLATIAKIKPSEMYSILRNDAYSDLNGLLFGAQQFVNKGENIQLRFILLSTTNHNLIAANFEKFSMEFMQLISNTVKRDDATIFPIPFAPCNLSNATVCGNNYYQEISLTFKLSNIIKNLRMSGKKPAIKLSTMNNQINIEVFDIDANKVVSKLEWNLQPVDDFAMVCDILERLFADMQLNILNEKSVG